MCYMQMKLSLWTCNAQFFKVEFQIGTTIERN